MRTFIELVKQIFRTEIEDYSFPIFSSLHFKILFFIGITIFFIIIFRKQLKNFKYKRILEVLVAIFLISTQVFLFIWYLRFPNFYLKESLPLYPCRIAIIMASIALLWKNEFSKAITYFFGTIGGSLALLIPLTNPYFFPHITYYTFFVGHYFLLVTSLYIILVEGFVIKKKHVKQAIVFSFFFALCAFIANYILDANYAFLNPENGYEFLSRMNIESNILTTSIATYLGFVFLIFIMYLPFKIREYREKSLFEDPIIKY